MINETTPTYHHTQNGPWFVLLFVMGVGFLVLSWTLREEPALPIVFLVVGLLSLSLVASFRHLTVSDEGDYLAVWFGPLPLFQRRIPYADIVSVEVSRTLFLDGWGIHYSVRGGWVWNIWGRACVKLRLRNHVMWIGTDDAENLAQFLRSQRHPETAPSPG